MDDKFFIGVVLGMIGGALITANSVKARKAVKDGQEQVMQKAKEMQKSKKSE